MMNARARGDWFRTLSAMAGLATIYFALAEPGLIWSRMSGVPSPVFPAAGAALAGLVLGGTHLWPAVLLGRAAASLGGGTLLPLWAGLVVAAGNALAAVAGARALRRLRLDPALTRLNHVLALIASVLASSALSATVGTTAIGFALDPLPEPLWMTWLNWWAGDAAGMLVVTPLVLNWARGEPLSRSRAWWMHLALSTATAALVSWMIFGPRDLPLVRTFLVFPVLIWAALACGVRGGVTAMLPVSVIAVWGTVLGHGPFAATGADPLSEPLRFVLLQQFIGISAVTVLVLAAVADEKRMKEALARTSERLDLAQRSARIGVFDWYVQTGEVVWTEEEERIFGLTPGTFDGTIEGWARQVLPEDLARMQEGMAEAMRQGSREMDFAFRVVRPDGEVRWVEGSGRFVYHEDGRPLQMVGVNIDVTERKRAEIQARTAEMERERLLQSERAARTEAERASRIKDEFLATISHELRTPLNAVLGWAQILARGSASETTVRQGLAVIERNARAQAQLIEDLLDMSRIITGKIRLEVQPVDLHDVISAAVETVRPGAEAKDIRIEQALDADVGAVRGDPNRLQQVVWNLVSNAVKFTPRGGTIRVSLERVDAHAEVTVTDNGQGIEPEFLPFVFDRFRQADGSITRQHGGLGLGLAIAKQLAELHGGRLRASSPGRGLGSTFVFELPLTAHRPADQPAAQPTPELQLGRRDLCGSLSLAGLTVLVVDDEPDTLSLVRYVLEECHARVLTCASAPEALELLGHERPGVLLSDIGMPEMDGYELIRRVRKLAPPLGIVPAAALTAFARSEDRRQALLAGYQAHLAKPVEPGELVALVASLAGRDQYRVAD